MRNLAGQVIKGYELNELIGVGGFAAVYRAYQPAVDREVAIKVVLPKYTNAPEFVRRFESEAQLIARLEHIHIVPLYDYWREPNNAYLVMRWLRGGSLYDSLVDRGAWTVPETARLLDQIASALMVAHRKEVVHQDLTPANILFDEEVNAFLTDFGIAKELAKESNEEDRTLFGSPAYMAPEQILGRGVSPQTDIYSLGIVIYQALTRQVPFDDPSHTEIMKQQVNAPLPPLQMHRPELPFSLNMVVMQATSKNPMMRYKDAISMAHAFRKAMALSGMSEGVLSDVALSSFPITAGEEIEAAAREEHQVPTAESTRTRDLSTQDIRTIDLGTESIVPPEGVEAEPAFPALNLPPEPKAPVSRPKATVDLEPELDPLDFDFLLAPENPYKGLRAFEEIDAVDFFGREELIERLLMRLDDPLSGRFLAVVGPSGSGKSSVVKAGLLPALDQGRIGNSDHWFVRKMVPGAHPFQELSTSLLGIATEAESVSEQQLRASVRGILRASQQILGDKDDIYLMLVIDQFEEVFTLVEDETERRMFLASLLAAVKAPESRLRVIVTLRADFYDRPLHYPEFGELIRQHTEIVLPLSPDELRVSVTGPAERVGLIIEPGLVDAIVTDVSEQPGTLPLLQYALTELFDQREDRTLTLRAYRDNGGVRGALARRAEETFNEMAASHQDLVRQVFLRLVSLGEGTEDTRRRVKWSEIMALGTTGQRATLREVIDTFGNHRLFTFDRDPQTREPTVEVAHEALIREWQRLRRWLDDNRDDLRIQRQLAHATGEWLAAGKESGFLATGSRLVQFESLVNRTRLILTEQEVAFVQASIALRQRAARRVKMFIAALIVISVIAVGAAVFAFDRQRVAEDRQRQTEIERDRTKAQARISQSGTLAVNALKNVDQGVIDMGLLLSLEAFKYADTFEARNSLLTSLQAAPNLRAYLHGHSSAVRCVAISDDGTLIAAGGRDGRILIWDAATRQVYGEPLEHGARVYSVAFNPDGTMLASGSSNGTVRLWDVATGEPLGEPLAGHEDEVWSVAFSPDGTQLVSGSFDGTLRLWDVVTGDPVGEPFVGHEDVIYDVAFSPDGTQLATASADYSLRLWDVATGEQIGEPLEGHSNWVLSVAFSPDGTVLASGGADNTVRLWTIASGEPLGQPLAGHVDWVWSVDFSPNGRWLLSGSGDNTALVWDMSTGQVATGLRAHTDNIWEAVFASDSRTLVTAGNDNRVLVWDIGLFYPLRQVLNAHTNPVWAIAVSPDGTRLASGSGENDGGGADTTVRVWNVATGEPLNVLEGHVAQVRAVDFSPDGATLASGSADGTLILWDVAAGAYKIDPIAAHNEHINSVMYNPDGSLIATAGDDGLIRLWDAQTGELRDELAGHEDEIYSLAFSPDGRWLASGSVDKTARLWDMTAAPITATVLPHSERVKAVAFSPDDRYLATGDYDNLVNIWAVGTWEPVHFGLEGHSNYIENLTFSPDSTMLASGSWDATIILWDVSTGRALGKPLAGHSDTVRGLAFTPDGKTLVSGSWDTTIGLWVVDNEAWKDHAAQVANRDLTPEEQARYVSPDLADLALESAQ